MSKRYPHELSGGQIQRVSVARALIPQPRLILADEPVSMVDASLRMEIVNVFRKLRDEQQVSVLYITHDLATAYYISDRIAIMAQKFVFVSHPILTQFLSFEEKASRIIDKRWKLELALLTAHLRKMLSISLNDD